MVQPNLVPPIVVLIAQFLILRGIVHGGRNIFLMPAPRAFLLTNIGSSYLSNNGPPIKPWRRAFFVTAELLFAELLSNPFTMLISVAPV